jgi:hypothetical protein
MGAKHAREASICTLILVRHAASQGAGTFVGAKRTSGLAFARDIFGRWQGLSRKQIRKREPRATDLWMGNFPSQPIPGAEPFQGFKTRVKSELKAILDPNQGRC